MPLLTAHARARMQQRGISPAVLDALLDFGRELHDHRGCRIVRFDNGLAAMEIQQYEFRTQSSPAIAVTNGLTRMVG